MEDQFRDALDERVKTMPWFAELVDAFDYKTEFCFCRECIEVHDDRRLFVDCLKVLANERKVTRALMLRFGNDWKAQHGFVKLLCLKQAKETANAY